jgi:hypothetical protein
MRHATHRLCFLGALPEMLYPEINVISSERRVLASREILWFAEKHKIPPLRA